MTKIPSLMTMCKKLKQRFPDRAVIIEQRYCHTDHFKALYAVSVHDVFESLNLICRRDLHEFINFKLTQLEKERI